MPAKRSRVALEEEIVGDAEQPAKKKGKQTNYYGKMSDQPWYYSKQIFRSG